MLELMFPHNSEKCYFCNASKSVKYWYKETEKDIPVPCCNRCALKPKKEKNYYIELDRAILEYEQNRPYKTHKISWISDKISWCSQFKKITKEQLENLCDRVCRILKKGDVRYEDLI